MGIFTRTPLQQPAWTNTQGRGVRLSGTSLSSGPLLLRRSPRPISYRPPWSVSAGRSACPDGVTTNTCFPAARQAPSLADSLGLCPAPFPVCPLMLQKCAFPYFGPSCPWNPSSSLHRLCAPPVIVRGMATITPFKEPGIRGFLHRPEGGASGEGLVVTHGAGGNAASPLLAAAADAFAAAGFTVLRCDLPFRQKRPRGPPSPAAAAADRAGLSGAVNTVRELVSGKVILGGVSYGGRQTMILAADESWITAALILFSYPLHPPGRPEQLRTEHFPRLRLPALFVQGTRDPFGSPEELRAAVAAIPAPTRVIAIEGAGHELKHGGFDLRAVVTTLRDLTDPLNR